jgi:hypothetical protein
MLEFHRILRPDGALYLTSLCSDRKISAWYLELLQKKGHVASLLHSHEILSIIEKGEFKIVKKRVRGGMLYIKAVNLPFQ